MYLKKAFTLIELMIVIAVIGIMTTAVVLQINAKQKGQQETQVAARQLEAAVREAQNNALNGIQFAGNNVCGYGVKVTASGQLISYHLNACSADNALSGAGDRTQQLQSVTASFANLAVGQEGYVFFTIPFGKLFTNAWTNGSMPNFQLASARDATVVTSVCANENLIKDGIGNATSCGAPAPPPPPPPPVCNNNGTCDAGETIANCPGDCTPPPSPISSASITGTTCTAVISAGWYTVTAVGGDFPIDYAIDCNGDGNFTNDGASARASGVNSYTQALVCSFGNSGTYAVKGRATNSQNSVDTNTISTGVTAGVISANSSMTTGQGLGGNLTANTGIQNMSYPVINPRISTFDGRILNFTVSKSGAYPLGEARISMNPLNGSTSTAPPISFLVDTSGLSAGYNMTGKFCVSFSDESPTCSGSCVIDVQFGSFLN